MISLAPSLRMIASMPGRSNSRGIRTAPVSTVLKKLAARGGYGAFGDTKDGAIFFAESSCLRFTDDANAAVSTVAWLRSDRDVHVLAERGQEAHQALA